MSDGASALETLFQQLAKEYTSENRPGGDAAAKALRAARFQSVPRRPNPYENILTQTLVASNHPICKTILTAMPYIRWGASDLRKGRIPDDLANQMPMCELLGPDGLVPNETVRVGLWLQQPGVTYGPRRHEAEETFLLFAGHALWSTENSPPTAKATGAIVHHRSNILHTSKTGQSPVFAAWRWSGNIGFDAYKLH